MRNKSLALSLVAALALTGCLAPDLEVAPPELPQRSEQAAFNVNAQWWNAFGDARLNALVEEALHNSDDLKLAAANVNLARATLGLQSAARFPSLDLSASGSRQRSSEESISPYGGMTYNLFDLAAGIGYEVDFWGKYRDAEAAAESELSATEADRDTVRISLVAGVAQLYIRQCALERQAALLGETVDAYAQSLAYRERQFRHGGIDVLTVERERAQLAGAEAQRASVEEARRLNINALGLMLGRTPKELAEGNIDATLELPRSLQIPAGIDSRLLERRPDIKAAEARLRAANTRIGVARADYFPSISLTGSLGVQSSDLDNLLQSSARTWGFGPALKLPLLDFGRVRSGVDSAEAQKEQALITYAKSVKTAFKEVYDALESVTRTRQQTEAKQRETDALETVLELSIKRFDNGYSDYLDVLDARRSLLAARMTLIDLEATLLTHQVTLYKALGGGWNAPAETSLEPTEAAL